MRKRMVCGSVVVLLACFLSAREVAADKKGEAGIALEEIPVYPRSDSLEAGVTLKKGQPVAAIRNVGLKLLGLGQYIFDEKDGRVQVMYFPGEDPTRGKFYNGWIDPAKLAKFYYDCSCGAKKDDCDPIVTRGLRFSFTWNSCFNDAWERKAAELAQAATKQSDPAKKESAEERLKKLDELLKKGLITKEEYQKKREEILRSL
jgi:putative oligomerization/nucleic acid binding protein